MRRTGYVFEEHYLFHDEGSVSYCRPMVQPGEAWENAQSKARFHNLVSVSGLLDKLIRVRARAATKEEILRFHTPRYHDWLKQNSDKRGGDAGDQAQFGTGSYEVALLAAGGILAAVEAILLRKSIDNAYCLVRPPGHHAVADKGMGFCLFNNIALAALHCRHLPEGAKLQRMAIVDYDVHHGNGTQECFWNDPDCLFISLHQDNNYPLNSGPVEDVGGPGAEGTTINIPLPPGSGTGAYKYAFEKCVIPALERFRPEIIFVSSGFDASYVDPLARMMVSSECFAWMAKQMLRVADKVCQGRIIFAHEGGYSKEYVPFCGLAVIEAISGTSSGVKDDSLGEVNGWAYQDCQPHQAAVVDAAAALAGLSSNSSETAAANVGASALSVSEQGLVAAVKKLLAKAAEDPHRRKALLDALVADEGSWSVSGEAKPWR